jgi:hypothetical protein
LAAAKKQLENERRASAELRTELKRLRQVKKRKTD